MVAPADIHGINRELRTTCRDTLSQMRLCSAAGVVRIALVGGPAQRLIFDANFCG
jgi:hypothetical protein